MPVLTKINTNAIADDAVTGDKFSGSGYLENTTNQDLSGTYSDKRLYTSDAYTVTGDVNVTGHLALGSVADEDIVITQDSTERTITGSGTLESGKLVNDPQRTSVTGMTGELGSVVTGSPNLNLGNATFPAGHILQVQTGIFTTQDTTANTTFSSTGLTASITPSSVSNKILVHVSMPFRINRSTTAVRFGYQVYRSASGSTDGYILTYGDGMNRVDLDGSGTTTNRYQGIWNLRDIDSQHNTAGSAVTYTVWHAIDQTNNSQVLYTHYAGLRSSITLMEVQA